MDAMTTKAKRRFCETTMSIQCPRTLADRVDAAAERQSTTRSAFLRQLIVAQLKQMEARA